MRAFVASLVGRTIHTLTGSPNTVLRVETDDVIVGTTRSPDGQPVPTQWVQNVADKLYAQGHLRMTPAETNHRSAFMGAVHVLLDDVEQDPGDPQRLRVAKIASRPPHVPFVDEELVLMLDLFIDQRDGIPRDVEELARFLAHRMFPGGGGQPGHFRTTEGVAAATRRWAAFADEDSPYEKRQSYEPIWAQYGRDRIALKARVGELRGGWQDGAVPEWATREGAAKAVTHLARERSAKLVEQRKTHAEKPLRCEVCAFDFEATYGRLGADFIEAHHTNPLSDGERTTKAEDLALVCANCHRMLHRETPPLTIEALRARLQEER